MNLPNKLSLMRLCLVPVFMIVLLLPTSLISYTWSSIIGAIIFTVASITDCLDGHIARKYNLITDFGKFLDPLADKFIVISAMTMIFYLPLYSSIRPVFVWVFIVVLIVMAVIL